MSAPQLSLLKRDAHRSAEVVAARFRDRVDHAALEASVFGRDTSGRDLVFLDGVFDVDVPRLRAQVLVDDDAVDEKEVLVGERARDHDVAARPVVGDAGASSVAAAMVRPTGSFSMKSDL